MVKICPCCGAKTAAVNDEEGAVCASCGARRVGLPLARYVVELPGYGRAVFALVAGVALVGWFLVGTLAAFLDAPAWTLNMKSAIAAVETAAWRLKWIGLPFALLSTWAGARIVKSVRRAPGRFAGLTLARTGVALSMLAFLLVAIGIGVTVPERLRRLEVAREAARMSRFYAADAALRSYYQRYGTLPTKVEDLKNLPDPDGLIADAIAMFDESSYTPSSVQAIADIGAARRRKRGTATTTGTATSFSNVSLRTDAATRRSSSLALLTNANDGARAGISFTNYDLVWRGEDGVFGTDDDLIMRDGRIVKRATPSASPLVKE